MSRETRVSSREMRVSSRENQWSVYFGINYKQLTCEKMIYFSRCICCNVYALRSSRWYSTKRYKLQMKNLKGIGVMRKRSYTYVMNTRMLANCWVILRRTGGWSVPREVTLGFWCVKVPCYIHVRSSELKWNIFCKFGAIARIEEADPLWKALGKVSIFLWLFSYLSPIIQSYLSMHRICISCLCESIEL